MEKSELLKKYILSEKTLIVPDAYDSLSARVIELTDFKAIQCSGLSMSISSGFNEEPLLSLKENITITKKIIDSVDLPVMADGEDGYGDSEETFNTIQKFITIGASGINIEDQILQGKNKSLLVDHELMKEKIISAKEAANQSGNPHFILNARTDALNIYKNRTLGLTKAIERANYYLDSGADMAFITYLQTKNELAQIKDEVNGPVSISSGFPYTNVGYTLEDCIDLGINRVSLPTALIFSAINGMKKVLEGLKNGRNLQKNTDLFCTKEYINKIIS